MNCSKLNVPKITALIILYRSLSFPPFLSAINQNRLKFNINSCVKDQIYLLWLSRVDFQEKKDVFKQEKIYLALYLSYLAVFCDLEK